MLIMLLGGKLMNTRSTCVLIGTVLLVLTAAMPGVRAQSMPQFGIDHYVLASAGAQSHSSCFVLRGTAGQAAPGYSSSANFALVSGFWATASLLAGDEIFFDGFEEC